MQVKNSSDVIFPQDKSVYDVTKPQKTEGTKAPDKKDGASSLEKNYETSTGTYNTTETTPNTFNFKPKSSIQNYQCIADAISEATGKQVSIESGKPLTEKLLQEVTGKKWDEIDMNSYTQKGNLNDLTKFLAESDKNEDGTFKPKTDTIISDGAHTYVLKDFQYKKNEDGTNVIGKDGRPIVTGLIVKDPASGDGETRTIKPGEIKQGKNFTAFVQERDTDKRGIVGDGNRTHKADGRMGHTFTDLKTAPVNPADGQKGSESDNIRLFFAALGDPRQKVAVSNVLKDINSTELKYDDKGNLDEASQKKLEDLQKTIKKNFGVDIPTDELEGIVKIFQSDVTSLGGDVSALIDKVKTAKAGSGEFGTYASGYFEKSGSTDKNKVTVGDMFLYMQSAITFSEKPLPSTANLNKTITEFPAGTILTPPVKGDTVDGSGMKIGKEYLDPVSKQIYKVIGMDSSTPPQALVKKLDGIGRTEHNYYSTGIQYVQLSFENYGSSSESPDKKAKSLVENINNLLHGAEGC